MFTKIAKQNRLVERILEGSSNDKYIDIFVKKLHDSCKKADTDFQKLNRSRNKRESAEIAIRVRFAPLIQEISYNSSTYPRLKSILDITVGIVEAARRSSLIGDFLVILEEISEKCDTINKVLINLHDKGYGIQTLIQILGCGNGQNLNRSLVKFAREHGIHLPQRNR